MLFASTSPIFICLTRELILTAVIVAVVERCARLLTLEKLDGPVFRVDRKAVCALDSSSAKEQNLVVNHFLFFDYSQRLLSERVDKDEILFKECVFCGEKSMSVCVCDYRQRKMLDGWGIESPLKVRY